MASTINWSELGVPIAVLAIVLAMITPLPSILLDILISANITVSVIVLMASMYITKPSDFSVYPTLLLILTLFRLALNISSSRLILLNGNTGSRAAGDVIEAFGNFVVGGNYVIGVVIFLVLLAIQYVVINHGAVRISEVTARFTLDAMPGKQMSIDSDLNAGLITETDARIRRKELAAEAEFYGAMDGASRFTQRDAIASIIITGINIVAGFLIGVLQHGVELKRALQTYTILTIGDGLVTVIPALMISVSGGLIVTRASSESRLGPDVQKQLFTQAQPLFLGAGVLLTLACFPGLPKIPFFCLAAATGFAGWTLDKKKKQADNTAAAAKSRKVVKPEEEIESLLKVEPLALEIGLGLVRFVEGGLESVLLRRIASFRRQSATDLGYVIPPVRVIDNMSLRSREYSILVKGLPVARFEMEAGREFAILPKNSGIPGTPLVGTPGREPSFNLPGVWILPDQIEKAKALGYTVADPVGMIGTHLAEVVKRAAPDLFSRQDMKTIIDRVAVSQPKLVEDLIPKQISMGAVQKIFQNLLRERVSIRDAASILEAIAEAAVLTKNQSLLTEYVRQAIRRTIIQPFLNPAGDLSAYFIDSEIEGLIEGTVEHGEFGSHVQLSPQHIRQIVDLVTKELPVTESGLVLITSSAVRQFVKQILENAFPSLAVISHNEVPSGVRVLCLGTVK